MQVSLLSLGCPKNLADSEALLRGLGRAGVFYTSEPRDADILLVNTCGFIEDARRESVDEILRLAYAKSDGQRLLVFGCLAKRYGDELRREIPEIDALFGVGEEEQIIRFCAGQRPETRVEAGMEWPKIAARGASVPIKVAEGCDRACAFCAIPSIRGGFRSRSPEDILREAEGYVGLGLGELVLVAQDLTAYGKDLGGYGLADLLKDMASIDGRFRIRPMYLHPSSISDALLDVIGGEVKVCRYVDLPLQHSDERLLALMGRSGSAGGQLELIGRIRSAVPGVTLRTALIVGFPGETEEDFGGLLDFIERARFERLGAFMYSREEGTRAAGMSGQVPEHVRRERFEAVMDLQAEISLESNRALIGRSMTVLVDSVRDEAGSVRDGTAVGRLEGQAPGIDGITMIRGGRPAKGDFVDVTITRAFDHDLEAVCK
jgi:ribosomal protein S12 methylthiotransferase